MISIQPLGQDRHEVIITTRSPLMYLDHWALRGVSADPARKTRFISTLKTKGTLLFSLMNVVEIANDPEPSRAAAIRNFLEQIGPYWVPMTIDPMRVLDHEATGRTPDGAHPCVSYAFLDDHHFKDQMIKSGPNLAHVVDLTRGKAGDDIRVDTDALTAKLQSNLQHWRDALASDKANTANEMKAKFGKVTFDAAKPMRTIYNGLARSTITDGFTLNANHMRDLYHAISAIRCADMVTLDGHWAGQVGKLKLPADFVKVYTQPQLDKFLDDFENWPTS